jgi:predicted Zn-dependent peptidase
LRRTGQYERYDLKNGIRVIHKRVKSQVAHLGIIVNTGSRDELVNEQGIAHFIEHTIFKGTLNRKAYHILNRLDSVGADMNAYTTKEETCIYASFLKEHFQRSIELFADISRNSIFPEREIKKEKDVIIDEINSYKDNPVEEIFDEIEELVFEGNPLGNNILGTIEHVENIKRSQIFRFLNRTYHTDQIVVCSVGDIPFSKVIRAVERYFNDLPEKTRDFHRICPTNYVAKTKQNNKAQYQAHCIIANQTYGANDEERIGLSLLNNILGGPGLNSRLNLGIREKYGFCYNLESNYTMYSDTGLVSIYLGTDFDFLDKTIELVHKELQKLREKKLGVLQLNNAKQQIKGQIAISNDNNVNEMIGMGKSMLFYDQVERLEESYRKIDALSASDLLNIANHAFAKDQLSHLIYTK